jgi:hypothetical protein
VLVRRDEEGEEQKQGSQHCPTGCTALGLIHGNEGCALLIHIQVLDQTCIRGGAVV